MSLVTVHAHNELNRVQEKLSFHMVVRVVQQDLETSLKKVWRTKRDSQREEKEDQ